MEIINLAAVALFNALDKHNIDRNLLIEGTGLKLDYFDDLQKKHTWDQFVRMYSNCANLLGPEETTKEIGYQGIYNENIALIRKVGTGLLDIKTGYWYTATFVAKHLFKESVTFKYKKINKKQVTMEINIHPDLVDCPLLLQTYTHLFEILPTALGLPKASVTARITDRKGEYTIYLKHTSYFKLVWKRFVSIFTGDAHTIELITSLENQSIELSKVIDEKSQLLRIVSHDIANQISIIDFYLKKTMRNEELNEEDQKYLSIAKNSSNKLYNILKNVQNMEVTSLRGIDIVPVDIEKIFMSIKEDFQSQIKHKKLFLKCRNELNPSISVLAEATSLETNVLGNLMTNAIKFSPEGSTIELRAKLRDDKVIISVSDQGMGIPFEDRQSLFTKKLRNSSAGTMGEMGTGFWIRDSIKLRKTL